MTAKKQPCIFWECWHRTRRAPRRCLRSLPLGTTPANTHILTPWTATMCSSTSLTRLNSVSAYKPHLLRPTSRISLFLRTFARTAFIIIVCLLSFAAALQTGGSGGQYLQTFRVLSRFWHFLSLLVSFCSRPHLGCERHAIRGESPDWQVSCLLNRKCVVQQKL